MAATHRIAAGAAVTAVCAAALAGCGTGTGAPREGAHGPNEATIFLSAEMEGAWVRVTVRDEGEPLPQASIERLFEPHSRGRRVKAKGTGLGLYIVRSIAQRWGGEAWGKALATGNEFGFSVPLR